MTTFPISRQIRFNLSFAQTDLARTVSLGIIAPAWTPSSQTERAYPESQSLLAPSVGIISNTV